MSEYKISELLEQVKSKSSEIGDNANAPFTAERFIVVLIDMIRNHPAGTVNRELEGAAKLLDKYVNDLKSARSTLMEHIEQKSTPIVGATMINTSLLDDLYMKKKLTEASKTAESVGAPNVDCLVLLIGIFHDPSETIKKIMNKVPADARDVDTLLNDVDKNKNSYKAQSDVGIGADLPESSGASDGTPAEVRAKMSKLVQSTKQIREELRKRVFGQDNAINTFVTGYFQAQMLAMLDKSRKRPKAAYLFAGPPGVGKTFLAEEAAKVLGRPFMRFDMSEYSDKEANLEFCGSDKVYKNGKAGNVTSFVAANPSCVLLFDEIEKAHLCVIHLFLQMLDAGRLRDNFTDEEVSFSDAIIIMTTNAGKQLYEESESGDFSSVSRKVIIKALMNDVNPETSAPYFPAAICSRFASGNVVMFNQIGAHNLREIAKKEITRHAGNFEKSTDVKIGIDERVYTALMFSQGSEADARTIRSRAETFFNDEMYELMRLVSSDKTESDITDIEKINITMDLTRTDSEIKTLFETENKARVLIFADAKTVDFCQSCLSDFCIIGSQDIYEATEIIRSREIDFVLIDVTFGASLDSLEELNIEDAESPARDFFKYLRVNKQDLPVYLLENKKFPISDEEKVSFIRQGVRDVLNVDGIKSFEEKMDFIATAIHQQASMIRLAKENKLVSFETSQTISDDGKEAEITLFDFEMRVAVDSEDAKNVMSSVSKPNVHFDDVIGAGDAKNELSYFVEYLKNPKKYTGTGVKAPKGVLLYGPPGTGKTMLAKAMACEAGVTFIAAEGNQFLKKFVGEGSEKVHELFKTARKYAPSILFVDEIDAIAKERRGGLNAGATGEETLTAFLTEMDGFSCDPTKPVFVLAATNFDVEPGGDKSLDPALMRRFDRRVYIDLPKKEDRIRFMKKKISENRALCISEDQLDNIAIRSTGMSLAELDSVFELALRSAIREGSVEVNDAILEEAFETFNSGEVKKWDESQLERVARHESGHALICYLSGETPSYLTVVARGNHGGYMQHADSEGKAIYTKDELLSKIRTALGGRAAEIVYYGERDGISTGASGDLISATNTARQIVCTYGMDDEFGLAVVNGAAADNGTMSVEVRAYVNRILNEQMKEAVSLVSENKDKIDSLVKELMSKNHLNGNEIEVAINRKI